MCAYAQFVLVVTTDDLPGYVVRAVLGEVVGSTARSQNAFHEGVKSLQGGMNPRASEHLARWREEAVKQMADAARERGANAVIGMRFDHRMISDYWGEICAYGTAVVAVPREPSADDGELPGWHERQSMGAGT
jgi:uncharacterized protein YbjQ (UPF0145 family)